MAIVKVRNPQTQKDWDEVRRLCCLTGDNGGPIELSRWPFFSEFWIGPYQTLLPTWTYLAVVDGQIKGYLTGCPDTKVFEVLKHTLFTPKLITEIALNRYPINADVKRFLKRTLRLELDPVKKFPKQFRKKIVHEYPAHLHVNIDSESRGHGIGLKLMNAFKSDLAERSPEVALHVFCGQSPVSFYERAGFVRLGNLQTPKVFAMGCKLDIERLALNV